MADDLFNPIANARAAKALYEKQQAEDAARGKGLPAWERTSRCWCGGDVHYEFGWQGRHGLWCQYGHPHKMPSVPPLARSEHTPPRGPSDGS